MKFNKLDPIFGDRDDSYLYRLMQFTTAFTCGYCSGKLTVWLLWITPDDWLRGAIALVFLLGAGAFYLYCRIDLFKVFLSAIAGSAIGGAAMWLWIIKS